MYVGCKTTCPRAIPHHLNIHSRTHIGFPTARGIIYQKRLSPVSKTVRPCCFLSQSTSVSHLSSSFQQCSVFVFHFSVSKCTHSSQLTAPWSNTLSSLYSHCPSLYSHCTVTVQRVASQFHIGRSSVRIWTQVEGRPCNAVPRFCSVPPAMSVVVPPMRLRRPPFCALFQYGILPSRNRSTLCIQNY